MLRNLQWSFKNKRYNKDSDQFSCLFIQGGSKLELIREKTGGGFDVMAQLTSGDGYHFTSDSVSV